MKIFAPELRGGIGILFKEVMAQLWLGTASMTALITYIPTLGWSWHYIGKPVNTWYEKRLQRIVYKEVYGER